MFCRRNTFYFLSGQNKNKTAEGVRESKAFALTNFNGNWENELIFFHKLIQLCSKIFHKKIAETPILNLLNRFSLVCPFP